MMDMVWTYKNLLVWQKAFCLTETVYRVTTFFPDNERFGLTSQMRRAAVSIPSNIAEGYRRQYKTERRQFAHIAFGSASELETQLALAIKMQLAPEDELHALEKILDEVLRLLNLYCRSLH
jgi:four helix bundle protein